MQEAWGHSATHNTSKCHKYEKDSTARMILGRTPYSSTGVFSDKKSTNAYVQISAKIAKLVKDKDTSEGF